MFVLGVVFLLSACNSNLSVPLDYVKNMDQKDKDKWTSKVTSLMDSNSTKEDK
jgi:hypothetical protein